jgi:RNA polymerase sporulation-specific sigma factor
MQDEEVVGLARAGHLAAAECLISRYRPLVESKARAYFVAGADRDDVVQEGMIGLYKAIRDFRSDRLARFRPFAELCVTRQIITAVKTATRQKHVPLNGYVSLNRPNEDRACDELLDRLQLHDASMGNPSVLERTLPADLEEKAGEVLSELEIEVLRLYLEGMSYREMSKCLGCATKSIDNALQRVKRKVSSLLNEPPD